MDAGGDLARLMEADEGYSSVRRGTVTLYPVRTVNGALYFSRKAIGDGAAGNSNVLVKVAGKA